MDELEQFAEFDDAVNEIKFNLVEGVREGPYIAKVTLDDGRLTADYWFYVIVNPAEIAISTDESNSLGPGDDRDQIEEGSSDEELPLQGSEPTDDNG